MQQLMVNIAGKNVVYELAKYEDFKTEALFIMKLQHKNLVRLLGFCVEGKKKLLVYELVANSSLDKFLFGSSPFWTYIIPSMFIPKWIGVAEEHLNLLNK